MALKNSLSESSPFGKLVLLGILMSFSVGFALVGFFIWNEFTFKLSVSSISNINVHSDSIRILAAKTLQIFSQIGLFILPAILFGFLTANSLAKGLSFKKWMNFRNLILITIITLLSLPFINFLAEWNASWHLPQALSGMEDWARSMQLKNDRMMEAILIMNTPGDIIINVVMMAVLPALGEELIFRGILQKQLQKWLSNPHVAIITTAFIFSAIHLQFLGFFSRFILGIIFGYIFYFSKNIWTAIWAHFVNNFLALSIAFYYGAELAQEPLTGAFDFTTIFIVVVALFLSVYLLYRGRTQLNETTY